MSVREKRKGSDWRHRKFRDLCQRDGVYCQECGDRARRFWARHCSCSSEFGSIGPFTAVYMRSSLEVDHVIPLSEGGGNELENLQLLCIDCHAIKTGKERSIRMAGNTIAAKRVMA